MKDAAKDKKLDQNPAINLQSGKNQFCIATGQMVQWQEKVECVFGPENRKTNTKIKKKL